MKMFVIAVGNPFDGITLHGVFDSDQAANDAADRDFDSESWNVVEVHNAAGEL